METTRLCPECQTPLPADAPAGLCPRCLLQQGALRDSASAPTEPPRRAKGPPSAPPLADVAARFPQFEVRQLIGVGGMGAVYEVRQPQLDRIVALKVMLPEVADDPKFAERFTRAARALAKLNHPNIVAVYDFGQAGDWFYLVMEFVDGANLRQTMRAGRLTAAQALAIVPKLCDALQFAHDEGIMHRDIKPENILLDKKGRVKIADFGLAKLLGAEPDDPSITVTGVGMGTPRYMAPEQIENAKSVDHRADIYSLGVVFYEMLTGELPLGRFEPPSARVQVDVRLDEIVLKALEKSPQRRYQQASEVKSQVENVANTSVKSSPPAAAPTPAPPTTAPIVAGDQRKSGKAHGAAFIAAGTALTLAAFAAFYGVACNFHVYNQSKNAAFVVALLSVVGFSAGLAIIIAGILRRPGGQAPADEAARLRTWKSAVAVAGFAAAAVMLLWGFGATFTGPGVPPRTDMLVWLPYAFALIGSTILLVKPPAHPRADCSNLLPETVLASLGCAIAALPWRGLEHIIPNPWSMACNSAWKSEEGALFSLAYFALGVFLLITGGGNSRTVLRPAITLLTGLIALGLLRHFATHPPPSNAPGGFGYLDHRFNTIWPSMLYQSNFAVAVITAFLTVLVGAIQLRNRAVSPPEASAEKPADDPRLSATAQIQARSIELMIAGLALAISGLIGSLFGMTTAANSATTVTNPAVNVASRAALGALLYIPLFLGGIAAFIASLGMRKLRWHPFALVMSILLMLVLPGVVIANHAPPPQLILFQVAYAFYAGLRAFLLLRRREVEAVFSAQGGDSSRATPAPVTGVSSGTPPARQRPRHLLSAALVLLCLFGFFFGAAFHAKRTGDTSLLTIGALDPVFIRESGPGGFSTKLNFFSWSFFALMIFGVAFSALLRVGREDEGKVPRDPGWWRDWWKQVGLWGGLLLAVCVVRTVMNPRDILLPAAERKLDSRFAKPLAAGAKSAATDNAVIYLEGHTAHVKAIAVSPDGRTLVSAGMDGRVITRALPDGKLGNIAVITHRPTPNTAPPAPLRALVISADGRRAIVGGDMRELQRVDLASRQIETLRIANETGATIDKLMVLGTNQLAYLTIRDEEIVFYDPDQQRTVAKASINPGQTSHVGRAVASPNGKFIALTTTRMAPKPGNPAILESTAPHKVAIYDHTGAERRSLQLTDAPEFTSAQIAFPDARTLAVCLPSGRMLRWTLDAAGNWNDGGDAVRIAPGRYTACAASRDGKIIWLAEGNQITGIDSTSGQGVAFLELKIGPRLGNFAGSAIDQLVATSDPLTLAAALWDGKVALAKCRPLGAGATKTPAATAPPVQPFMIGLTGPELTTEAITKLKLSKLQTEEINRIVVTYHRDYLALQRRHAKVGKDAAGRILVTIAPFYDECLALAQRLQTELGGIVDPALLPVVKNGELPFQIFNWGGACNATVTLWKADGKYHVEEKLTSSPGHPRDPFTFNISGPKLEEIPPQFRIYWREE